MMKKRYLPSKCVELLRSIGDDKRNVNFIKKRNVKKIERNPKVIIIERKKRKRKNLFITIV